MARVFNFSAGPAALPLEVLEEAHLIIPITLTVVLVPLISLALVLASCMRVVEEQMAVVKAVDPVVLRLVQVMLVLLVLMETATWAAAVAVAQVLAMVMVVMVVVVLSL